MCSSACSFTWFVVSVLLRSRDKGHLHCIFHMCILILRLYSINGSLRYLFHLESWQVLRHSHMQSSSHLRSLCFWLLGPSHCAVARDKDFMPRPRHLLLWNLWSVNWKDDPSIGNRESSMLEVIINFRYSRSKFCAGSVDPATWSNLPLQILDDPSAVGQHLN